MNQTAQGWGTLRVFAIREFEMIAPSGRLQTQKKLWNLSPGAAILPIRDFISESVEFELFLP